MCGHLDVPGCPGPAPHSRMSPLVCGSRDGPAAAPGLVPKLSPVHAPPALRSGASPNSSHQVFLSALTLPPWEGEGRSSLFPAEPVARAFTSTTDRSKTRIKESFPVFFSPFSFFFCFNIRCSKHHVKSHSLLRNRRLPRGPGTAGRIPCPCPEWRCGTGQELHQLQRSRGA